MEIMSNVHLNTNFQSLARELDIMEPKVLPGGGGGGGGGYCPFLLLSTTSPLNDNIKVLTLITFVIFFTKTQNWSPNLVSVFLGTVS